MQYYGLTRGKAVSIPLDGKFQQIMLDPEVYYNIITNTHIRDTIGYYYFMAIFAAGK